MMFINNRSIDSLFGIVLILISPMPAKSKSQIIFLTFLALPLSFVGIPIYLNISDFYARSFDLNLALIGFLLIFIRAFDALQDPAIGWLSDHLASKKITRHKIITFASIFLSLSFYLIFNPPLTLSQNAAIAWFVMTLSLTYTCFNFITINFESLAAISAQNDSQRITINSYKEFFGILGMILAFILPAILSQFFAFSLSKSYTALSLVFAVLILFSTLVFLPRLKNDLVNFSTTKSPSFSNVLKDKKFLFFLTLFVANSVAVSLPAANLNFFIRDILHDEKNLGWFLSIYFLSACLFIPLWKIIFKRFGIVQTWICSIAFSVLTFLFAYFLKAENSLYFYAVCFFSGMFLGPDLIAPPIILAQLTRNKKQLVSSYFSMWNMAVKFGLMIAASGSLIILSYFGYQPANSSSEGLQAVAFFYAALPCLLKILVITLLFKWKKYEN